MVECQFLSRGILRLPGSFYDKVESVAISIKLAQGDSWCHINPTFRDSLVTQEQIYRDLDDYSKEISGTRATSIGNDSFVGKQGIRLSDADS